MSKNLQKIKRAVEDTRTLFFFSAQKITRAVEDTRTLYSVENSVRRNDTSLYAVLWQVVVGHTY